MVQGPVRSGNAFPGRIIGGFPFCLGVERIAPDGLVHIDGTLRRHHATAVLVIGGRIGQVIDDIAAARLGGSTVPGPKLLVGVSDAPSVVRPLVPGKKLILVLGGQGERFGIGLGGFLPELGIPGRIVQRARRIDQATAPQGHGGHTVRAVLQGVVQMAGLAGSRIASDTAGKDEVVVRRLEILSGPLIGHCRRLPRQVEVFVRLQGMVDIGHSAEIVA